MKSTVRSLEGAVRLGAKRLAKAGLRHLPMKRQIFHIARGLHPPRSIYARLPVHGPFRVAANREVSFRLFGNGSSLETDLFWGGLEGYDERESLRCWMRLCRNSPVIVDVGASIGIYSLLAAAVNPSAFVFGFEPSGRSYDMFKANCELNMSGVRPIRAAVGDRDGMADLFVPADLMIASLARTEGVEPERVPIRTLKAFLADCGLDRVDLVKVDVETFEPAVITGMGDLIARCHPSIIVEVLNNEVGGALERICAAQYSFFHIDEHRGAVRSDRLQRVSHESRNYLLCTETVARELGLA
jgi:FkbM family methyltransferase